MSIRSQTQDDSYASAVRRDLQGLKETAQEANRLDNLDQTVRPDGTEAAAAYDSLLPHEQAAASLGAHPDAMHGFVVVARLSLLRHCYIGSQSRFDASKKLFFGSGPRRLLVRPRARTRRVPRCAPPPTPPSAPSPPANPPAGPLCSAARARCTCRSPP